MEPTEVVVTGVGMVTPLGATAGQTVKAWSEGQSAPRRTLPELAGTPLENAEVAVLPEIQPADRLGGRRVLKYMSDTAVLGCLAAREAAAEAESRRRFTPENTGLYAGTGLAAASVAEVRRMIEASMDEGGNFSCRLLGAEGLRATNPLLSFKILANMPPCLISLLEGIKGPNFIFTPWEGQTGAALFEAWRSVAANEVQCALVGGADSAAHPPTFVFLRQAGLLKEDEYPASGAAYLVFEKAETAKRDGKRMYASITDMRLSAADERISDPLSKRLGRSFAAAPAILLGIACMSAGEAVSISINGVDGQKLEVDLAGC